jgi:hypothetical protein
LDGIQVFVLMIDSVYRETESLSRLLATSRSFMAKALLFSCGVVETQVANLAKNCAGNFKQLRV